MQGSDLAGHRQSRSIRNDERILAAAVKTAAGAGWSDLLPARVAEAAGLSRSTVSDRFADRSALAAWTWSQALTEALEGAVEQVVGLVAQPGGTTSGGGAIGARDVSRVMRPFVHPDESMRAAAELLVVGTFDATVHDAIRGTLGVRLDAWLTPVPHKVTKAAAARRAFLVIVALGSLLETLRHEGKSAHLESEWTRIAAALGAPEVRHVVPEVHFEHWDGVFKFDTGDGMLDRLLGATRDEIGRKGYDATTIESIGRAAGHTKGLVFSRYPSKKQLFNDTTARYTKAMFELNEKAFAQMSGDLSPGIAEAALFREFMRPGREHLRVFALEQYRLSWHDDEMRTAIATSMADAITARIATEPSLTRGQWEAFNFVEAAEGVGTLLVASYCPGAWTLPYQVMTVPLDAIHPSS